MKIKNKKFEIEFIGDTQLKKFLRASKDRLKKLSEYFQILHQNEDQTMITIKIVSNEEIKILNKKFRKKNKVTDVLSFPDEHASGDIAIADSYILNKNQTINAQNFFMLVGHGLLHLFGYTHYDKQSRSNMRFLENTFTVSYTHLTLPTKA